MLRRLPLVFAPLRLWVTSWSSEHTAFEVDAGRIRRRFIGSMSSRNADLGDSNFEVAPLELEPLQKDWSKPGGRRSVCFAVSTSSTSFFFPSRHFAPVLWREVEGLLLVSYGVSDFGCGSEGRWFIPPALLHTIQFALSWATVHSEFHGANAFETLGLWHLLPGQRPRLKTLLENLRESSKMKQTSNWRKVWFYDFLYFLCFGSPEGFEKKSLDSWTVLPKRGRHLPMPCPSQIRPDRCRWAQSGRCKSKNLVSRFVCAGF